jgi:hypothetical protein
MLDLSDPLWKTFKGGYRLPYDASAPLRELETGDDHDVDSILNEFWKKLHHQGDVDIASYAAVPHLVRIWIERNRLDWDVFAIVACIESCRIFGRNPTLPGWLESDYHSAIKKLAEYGAHRFAEDWCRELTVSFLAVAAFAKGLSKQGRVLAEFTDDELERVFEQSY